MSRGSAGAFFIQKGKSALGVSTISKSNNYFFEALSEVREAKKRGRDVAETVYTMSMSLKKHSEVLKHLKSKIDLTYQDELLHEYKRVEQLEQEVETLNK